MNSQQNRPWTGLAAMAVVAVLCLAAARLPSVQNHGFSALILAIAAGMVLGNLLPETVHLATGSGVALAKGPFLRWGVILYGFNLTFQQVLSIGWWGVLTDIAVMATILMLGILLGTRVLGLDKKQAALIGAGSAVCGAAAVLAAAPVIKAKSEHVAVAVATVVVFGTLCIALHPWLLAQMTAHGYLADMPLLRGLFVGASVHEVAQVVAIGKAIDPSTAQIAVVTKMVRVMLLAPFLLVLMAIFAERGKSGAARTRIAIPWFAFGFIAVAGFNSLHLLPTAWVSAIGEIDTVLLAVAMVALGFDTRWQTVRQAGWKPLLLAAVLFVCLLVLASGSTMLLSQYGA